jgi:N-acyl-D-amino-acid deacylase
MTCSAWISKVVLVALAASIAIAAAQHEPAYDFVIRNGKIIDGTGNPAYSGDVGIKDGKIAFIGAIEETAESELDANGQIVCPGFIDVHTHAENVLELPDAENFTRMGVTTIVVGNCGGSEESLSKFFSDIEKKTVSVNVASLYGQNTVRRKVMGGNFNRPPTNGEMSDMKNLVDQAMRDGAVGLSTGLIYLPGTYSKTDEIVELAKVSKAYGGLYASHMRNESVRVFEAIDEFLTVAKEAKIRAELSHIKVGGEAMWGKSPEILAKLEKAREDGFEITQDQYAYTASSTSLSVLIPDAYLEGGNDEFKKRMLDAGTRMRAAEEMKATLQRRNTKDYTYAVIANCNSNKSLNGKNLVEVTKLLTGKDSLDDQIDMIFNLQLAGGASCIFHGMSEIDIANFMRHPYTMIASDSSCRDKNESVPHPRGYGNNARVLGRYVRELGVLKLEDAIRKMTSLPAQTFRLKNRGLLAEGRQADIVIFDPKTVDDPATYTDPHHFATGISNVLVNGILVIENGKLTGTRPGQAVRGPGYRRKDE